MAIRTAAAEWKGTLREGTGTFRTESGALEGEYSFGSRFEEAGGSNPEELVGAALAGCYSMALSVGLAEAGATPESIRTTAKVHLEMLEAGPTVTQIDLVTRVRAPGIDQAAFQETAEATKSGCPISRALNAEITLDATLES